MHTINNAHFTEAVSGLKAADLHFLSFVGVIAQAHTPLQQLVHLVGGVTLAIDLFPLPDTPKKTGIIHLLADVGRKSAQKIVQVGNGFHRSTCLPRFTLGAAKV
jgi:hypothetical protein